MFCAAFVRYLLFGTSDEDDAEDEGDAVADDAGLRRLPGAPPRLAIAVAAVRCTQDNTASESPFCFSLSNNTFH